MSTVTHLSLVDRKILSAKLAFLESRILVEQDFVSSNAFYLLDDITGRAWSSIKDKKNELSEDSIPLDAYLTKTLSIIIEADVEARLRHTKPDLVGRILPVLRENVETVTCKACVSDEKNICNGGFNDNLIVASGGKCISSIHKMFNLARDVTLAAYRAYASVPNNFKFPEIKLSTKVLSSTSSESKLTRKYHINGKTEQTNSGPLINLFLDVENLNFDTYKAIPYILFHECVAHAFQGINSPSSSRGEPPPNNLFAEGWMDWVALLLMEEIMNGKVEHLGSPKELLIPKSSIDTAREIHNLRAQLSAKDEETGRNLADGYIAAARVLGFLEKPRQILPNEIFSSPLEAFLKLSFDLNMMNYPWKADPRELFIGLIKSIPENAEFATNPPDILLRIRGYFSDYLCSGNITKLLKALNL